MDFFVFQKTENTSFLELMENKKYNGAALDFLFSIGSSKERRSHSCRGHLKQKVHSNYRMDFFVFQKDRKHQFSRIEEKQKIQWRSLGLSIFNREF
ncbi:hypothetical protein GH721_16280 [Kriegella sp. EG-1]|nr:hypothetical protein [Flavobacteriaceae bacterium EG-1]